MKVLLIGDTSGNPDEGMKNVSYRLKEYLNQIDNCDAYFVSLIEVIRNRKKFGDCDIINFMVGPSWRTFIYGYFLKSILNKRIIIIISFIHPKWNLFAKLSLQVFKPNAVIIQTQKWRDKCEKYIKIISDIPLAGIKSEKFFPVSEVEKNKLKKELGLPLNKIILLHVGHLNEGRNLRVLSQFNNSKAIFPIVIVSSTVTPDYKLYNSLKSNGVTIKEGYIPQIENYYKAADCYVFTTVDSNYSIQIPLSVIEALACNVPVITTKYEALPFYLPEKNSLLTYVSSFENLEELIIDILKNRKNNGHSNQELIKSFDWKVISEKLFDFYAELIKGKYEK